MSPVRMTLTGPPAEDLRPYLAALQEGLVRRDRAMGPHTDWDEMDEAAIITMAGRDGSPPTQLEAVDAVMQVALQVLPGDVGWVVEVVP